MRTIPFAPTALAVAVLAAGCAAAARDDGLTRAEAVQAQRIQMRLSTAGNRIRDEALVAYLAQRLATLQGDSASPLTIYLFDDPLPQADLVANRLLRVRLGLLLALRDEDELVFVLAHELAHRDLSHVAARRKADWDGAAAERDADRAAVDALRRQGRRESAAIALLQRLAAASTNDAYRRILDDRVASLRGFVADELTPAQDGAWAMDALLAPYRTRTPR